MVEGRGGLGWDGVPPYRRCQGDNSREATLFSEEIQIEHQPCSLLSHVYKLPRLSKIPLFLIYTVSVSMTSLQVHHGDCMGRFDK